jgi:hypothetical protein
MVNSSKISSVKFLKLSKETQNLYFHLACRTSWNNMVEAYPVMKLINANEFLLKELQDNELITILDKDALKVEILTK